MNHATGVLTPGPRPGVNSRAEPRGFALVEVLLALTLGALVVLAAHGVFTGVADGALRLREARTSLDHEANARRWLSAAFGSLDVGTAGGGFAGREEEVQFGTWLLTAHGWYSQRRVTLTRRDDRLIAEAPPDASIELADSVSDLQLDYLLDVAPDVAGDSAVGAPGERARFVREWSSPVSAPVAIRLRVSHSFRVDTLFLMVGPRG